MDEYRYKHPTQVCPEDGGELWYWYNGSADPRWVCRNEDCDFWGLT